jgi:hypothetical protein
MMKAMGELCVHTDMRSGVKQTEEEKKKLQEKKTGAGQISAPTAVPSRLPSPSSQNTAHPKKPAVKLALNTKQQKTSVLSRTPDEMGGG